MFANVVNLINEKLFPINPILLEPITNPPKAKKFLTLGQGFPTLRNLLMHVMLKAKIGRSEFQSLAVSSRAFAPARAASRVQRDPDRPRDRRAVYSADSAMKIAGPPGTLFWWLEVRIFPTVKVTTSRSKIQERWHSSEWRLSFWILAGNPCFLSNIQTSYWWFSLLNQVWDVLSAFAAVSNLGTPRWQMSRITKPWALVV